MYDEDSDNEEECSSFTIRGQTYFRYLNHEIFEKDSNVEEKTSNINHQAFMVIATNLQDLEGKQGNYNEVHEEVKTIIDA